MKNHLRVVAAPLVVPLFACADPTAGDADPAQVIEQNEPEFACVDGQGAAVRLTLAADGIARTQNNGVGAQTAGRWTLNADGTIVVAVDGVVDESFETVASLGMLLQLKSATHACSAFHYAGDDGQDASFSCTSQNEPDAVFETTLVKLTRRDGVVIERESALVGGGLNDVVQRTFAGVYRVDGDALFAAWGNDEGDIETLSGSFDGDDLLVPGYASPRCSREPG
jgi:hypothetical protein